MTPPARHRESAEVAYEAWNYLICQNTQPMWAQLGEGTRKLWREISHDVLRYSWDEARKPPWR